MVSLTEVPKGVLESIAHLTFIKIEHTLVDSTDKLDVGRLYKSADVVVIAAVQKR